MSDQISNQHNVATGGPAVTDVRELASRGGPTTPPTDAPTESGSGLGLQSDAPTAGGAPSDEREALAKAVYYWDVSENVGSKAWDLLTEGQRDVWRSAADVILAAGFRRQGPITNAQVEAAGQAIRAELRPERKDNGPLYLDHDVHEYRNMAVAALEAARDAT